MASACIHWPFFTFTGRPVRPAATSRSVWRQRNAGIWSTSATAAACAGWLASCTSVRTLRPVAARGIGARAVRLVERCLVRDRDAVLLRQPREVLAHPDVQAVVLDDAGS